MTMNKVKAILDGCTCLNNRKISNSGSRGLWKTLGIQTVILKTDKLIESWSELDISALVYYDKYFSKFK